MPRIARPALAGGLLALAVLVAGCGPHPRVPPTSIAAAQADRTPRKVRVVKVWNQTEQRIGNQANALVTHFIEVDVLPLGGGEPERRTLPFDEFTLGHAPPEVGEELVIAPADWVAHDPRSMMRDYGAAGR